MEDRLLFGIHHIVENAAAVEPTKKGIVSVSVSFYDPLKVLSPCIVLFKLLLQKVWKAGLDWDESLFGELLVTWRQLVLELQSAPFISVPRCYFVDRDQCSDYSSQGFVMP